jgi:RNA polymerase sigma-70 factor (ECF subfamily)
MVKPDPLDISLLLSRERSEVKKFVEYFSDKIFNVAYSFISNRQDAEEITQDVFIACLNSLHSFQQKSSLDTWVYRIAINKSKDKLKYYKSKKRSARILSLSGDKMNLKKIEPADFRHPGIQLESQEQMNALYEAIYNLPENQKTALIMNKIEGIPQKEIAEILEMSVKGVESLLTRAKANLRKALEIIFEKNNT